MKANILSLGLTAPGLISFEQFKVLIAEKKVPNIFEPIEKYSPSFLPPNERRRTTSVIKLALKTAEEAWNSYQKMMPNASDQVPVLFVSKNGDTFITSSICQALSEESVMISPTQFHNSVHNASVGYWMIGVNNQAPASAISAGESAIGNGLLEAVLQSQEAQKPVLVVFYDLPVDESIPLTEKEATRDIKIPFAFAMVLEATQHIQSNRYPTLSLNIVQSASELKAEYNPYQGVVAAEIYPLVKVMAKLNFGSVDFERSQAEVYFPLNKHSFVKVALNETSARSNHE
ncbi:3-oxoacyl-[ACP] synthase [hydrothermal vent metagenome]|uniref:3-oxoacyl-[ACP] synthase n=1 Tax=hydrothermal vent metagenome TaxID=652676 RepID=A0A3B0W368_9ZZZZ